MNLVVRHTQSSLEAMERKIVKAMGTGHDYATMGYMYDDINGARIGKRGARVGIILASIAYQSSSSNYIK